VLSYKELIMTISLSKGFDVLLVHLFYIVNIQNSILVTSHCHLHKMSYVSFLTKTSHFIFTPILIVCEYIVFSISVKLLFWTCCFRLTESTHSVQYGKSVIEITNLIVKTTSRLVLPVPRNRKITLSVL